MEKKIKIVKLNNKKTILKNKSIEEALLNTFKEIDQQLDIHFSKNQDTNSITTKKRKDENNY
jgi:hypothetical protein